MIEWRENLSMPAPKNRLADLEKLLRASAERFHIPLKEKSIVNFTDADGLTHYIIPDLLYEDDSTKIAIEIGGDYASREKKERKLFKDQALRKMGYTVLYFDIESGDMTQIEAFIEELQRIIFQHKGAGEKIVPEYLASSGTLASKLSAKIQERKQGKENPVKEAAPIAEVAAPKPVEVPQKIAAEASDPSFSVNDLIAGKKPEVSLPEEVSVEKKKSHKFGLLTLGTVFGGALSLFLLFGINNLSFLQKNTAPLQDFSANIFGSTPIEMSISPVVSSGIEGSDILFENTAGQNEVKNWSIALPAHTMLIQKNGTLVLTCSAGFEKVPQQNACVKT